MSIEFVPMWNYYKALELNDSRYLLKLSDYEVMPDINTNKLDNIFDDIKFDIQDLDAELSSKSKHLFDKQKSISLLELKYFRTQTILCHLRYEKDNDSINELADLGYRIDLKKDYAKELNRVYKQTQMILTKTKIEHELIKDLTPKSVNSKIDIYSEIESIERYRKLPIDPFKMPMKQWINIRHKVIKEVESKVSK